MCLMQSNVTTKWGSNGTAQWSSNGTVQNGSNSTAQYMHYMAIKVLFSAVLMVQLSMVL